MSARDNFRTIQTALGVEATGIPNDATKAAFQKHWDEALSEYRTTHVTPPPQSIPDRPKPSRYNITGNWIDSAKRVPFVGGAPLTPECLVIHFTAGASAQSSIDFWKSEANGVLAHLVIDRDGSIFQCRNFLTTCGHAGPAGKSRWINPRTKVKRDGMNQYSIGIEIANAGDSADEIKWVRERPGFKSIRATHRNDSNSANWEVYQQAQLEAVTEVSKLLVAYYKLADVTGHDCIAPERKNDPGPAFPMKELREACGFSGLPAVHYP